MEEVDDQMYCKQCLVPIGTSVNRTPVSKAGFSLYVIEMQGYQALRHGWYRRLLDEWML